MRWFTDEAYEADEPGWLRMLADYRAHLDSIAPRLPPDLLALATEPRLNLHDARFREVRVDRDAAEVDLTIECGDLQVGYRRINLQFGSASIVPDNLYLLAQAIGAEFRSNHWHRQRTVTEILAHEVDVRRGGRFVLALRLTPFHEFAIEFATLSLTEVPIAERSPARAARYVSGTRRQAGR
jgi:hypothetical protein